MVSSVGSIWEVLAVVLMSEKKQSIENICWETWETGETEEKKLSTWAGHLKLKEDVRRRSCKWFIRILL